MPTEAAWVQLGLAPVPLVVRTYPAMPGAKVDMVPVEEKKGTDP
ncbi:MAG: hypothetical protein BWY24_00613 [Microgenomates group bacterium ADurb.Bin219]|nr:MAG: hypothetical protein BWY24_00613 [Microgenomates group bacterium ADurb.Bin219]